MINSAGRHIWTVDLHYQSREWSWLQQITLSHAIFRHSLKVSMDHKLFPLNSFYSAVLFWDCESLTVWAQLIRLTSVLEICLVYLSKHSFIHKYLDRCWVHKRHFFCFFQKTVCPGDWKWRNFKFLLDRGL